MRRVFHRFVPWALAAAGASTLLAAGPGPVDPYEVASFTVPESRIDQLVFRALEKAKLPPALPCSDAVFVRRASMDLLGLPPTAEEASRFLKETRPNKRMALIDSLLEREAHVDYWTMRWCDVLRVKSEFPVNLWPNAVQAYQRWIHDCLAENLPYDQMARQMLTSSGSNFRVPPVNFFRAVQGRGVQPVASAVALTFMGSRIERWPADRRAGMESMFSRLAYKPTAEWKEEIVCLDPAPMAPLRAVLPDGRAITVPAGSDPREAFAAWLLAPDNKWFARAAVNRTWAWVFGRGIVHEPDDIRPGNPPSVPGLLDYLEKEFAAGGYDQRKLLRLIMNSRVYQLSSIPRTPDPRAAAMFASYPVRRLEAEVLLDAVCAVTGTTEGYNSPIPEPFTYIPPSDRSVNLADGSITSPFLELFGRSPRDSGRVMERANTPSAAQRLYLLNSSQIHGKIEKSWRLKAIVQKNRDKPAALAEAIYLAVLSRPPTAAEASAALAHGTAGKAGVKQAADDLVWALINSCEFLHRH